MTKPLELHDRIARITRELGEINKALTPETTPAERLALLKLEHTATGAAIEALEAEEKTKCWAGRKVSDMTRREKSEFVAECGYEAFAQRCTRRADPPCFYWTASGSGSKR